MWSQNGKDHIKFDPLTIIGVCWYIGFSYHFTIYIYTDICLATASHSVWGNVCIISMYITGRIHTVIYHFPNSLFYCQTLMLSGEYMVNTILQRYIMKNTWKILMSWTYWSFIYEKNLPWTYWSFVFESYETIFCFSQHPHMKSICCKWVHGYLCFQYDKNIFFRNSY